jgi:BASS family bile acid:Na+ symporter
VVAGTLLNRLFPRAAAAVNGVLPLIAIMLVILIVGGIVGGAKAQIAAHAGVLLLATFLLHAMGFALGYALARVLGLSEVEARTISIEVGMQNSGLGSGLAKTPAFAAQFASAAQAALAPVPAAISALWHVVIGSLLAGWWRRRG